VVTSPPPSPDGTRSAAPLRRRAAILVLPILAALLGLHFFLRAPVDVNLTLSLSDLDLPLDGGLSLGRHDLEGLDLAVYREGESTALVRTTFNFVRGRAPRGFTVPAVRLTPGSYMARWRLRFNPLGDAPREEQFVEGFNVSRGKGSIFFGLADGGGQPED